MKERMGKKGLSPVIASVLMILLVLVLAAIIFLWARGFIGEQIEKFGRPIEATCGEVKFEVFRQENELEIVNRGNVDIRHLDIKVIKGGNSEVNKFNFQVDAGESERGYVLLEMSDGEVPDEIIVFPALIGNVQGAERNNVFTCMDSGVTL